MTDNALSSSSLQQPVQPIEELPNSSDRTETHGLFLMNPQHADSKSTETCALDIIAVHGITGDAYDTWKHENGTLWLRDFLPIDFPGARIFSFGYDARVFCSRGNGNVESYARTLLNDIKRERPEGKVISLLFLKFRFLSNFKFGNESRIKCAVSYLFAIAWVGS